MSQTPFSALVHEIIEAMADRKAQNIKVLDLDPIENSICRYFVIAEGSSNTQVKSIADSVEERVRKNLSEKPWHVEGTTNAEWVLMDYVDTVVHVFQKATREFYDLESLWGDAIITDVEEG